MHSSIKRMRPDDFHKPFFSAGDVLAILTPATSRRPLLRQGDFLMSNRTLTGIALIVLLSTLSISFGQTRKPPPSPIITTDQQVTTATLAGRLLDNVGNPISGALVMCWARRNDELRHWTGRCVPIQSVAQRPLHNPARHRRLLSEPGGVDVIV